MEYVVMILFYGVSIFIGRWLFANRGRAMDSGVYTVKKVMPWTLGYIVTAMIIPRIHSTTVATSGALVAWIFYALFFVMISLFYKATMIITKDFSMYCVDEFVTDESFIGWLRQRKAEKIVFRERYGLIRAKYSIDLLGYFGGSMLLMTVITMIKIL